MMYVCMNVVDDVRSEWGILGWGGGGGVTKEKRWGGVRTGTDMGISTV